MQETLPIHFAPLQGYTDLLYRNNHAACFGGVDTYYTPFVRFEKSHFRNRDVREAEPEANEVPHLVPQLIASTPETAEHILSFFVEKGYREVDINLGCPFPLLAKRHNGSGILPYPDEVRALLGVVERYSQLSFSVKLRLGWESPDECLRLVSIFNELPLRHITLHPRLGKQQYKGAINTEGFDAFRQLCHHPLIYNGDIRTVEDIHRLHDRFPALSGVMIGRGLLANPALALEYQENRRLSADELYDRLLAMHEGLYGGYANRLEGGEAQLLNKMKTLWEYLLPGIDRKLLKAVHKSTSMRRYNEAVRVLFSHLRSFR